MLYEQALLVFGIQNLVGHTETTLKKKYRELAKRRHTDVTSVTGQKELYGLAETKEAYQTLIDKLNDDYVEVKSLKIKPTVLIDICGLKRVFKAYSEGTGPSLFELLEQQNMKLALETEVILNNEAPFRKSLFAVVNTECQYTISLKVTGSIGDTIQVTAKDCFNIKITMSSPIFSIKVPVKVVDKVGSIIFDVSVRLGTDMEVALW